MERYVITFIRVYVVLRLAHMCQVQNHAPTENVTTSCTYTSGVHTPTTKPSCYRFSRALTAQRADKKKSNLLHYKNRMLTSQLTFMR